MRRWVSALLVVGIAAGLVGVGAPASAIDAPPPPVPESPWKESHLRTGASGSGGLEAAARRNLALLEAQRTRQWTPSTAPLPAGDPKVPPLRTAGNAMMLVAFAPMIVNGALTIVGASAEVGGQSADQLICNSIGTTADDAFLSALYGELVCEARILNPNEGVTVTTVLAYGAGNVVSGPKVIAKAGVGTFLCASFVGSIPAGFAVQTQRVNGTWATTGSWAQFTSTGIDPACNAPNWLDQNASVSYSQTTLYPTTSLRLINVSTQAVVSTSTTTTADPLRQTRCDVGWDDGTHTYSDFVGYRETEGFPLSAVDCAEAYSQRPSPGVMPETWKITSDDELGARTEIATGEIPDEVGAPAPSESNPSASRGLQLLKVVGTVTQSCMTWEAECADWWEESDSGQSTTSPYRCMYQGALIDLDECGLYRNSFVSAATRVVTDPATGEDVQWGTGTSPNTTNPGAGITPGDQCMASWAATANPIEWVLHPVKCALVWAFVPRAEKVAEARDSMDAKWRATSAGSVTAGLSALAVAFDQGVGCGGLPLHLDFPGFSVDTTLLASCEEPAAGIAATVRTCLVVVVWIGSFLAALRYLAALFGFAAFGSGRDGLLGGDTGGPRFQ